MTLRSPGLWLAIASLVCVPFAVDAFELPHLLVLSIGVVVCSGSARGLPSAALWLLVAGLSLISAVAPWLAWPAFLSLVVLAGFATLPQLDPRPLLWAVWPIAAWALLQATGHDPIQWQSTATWCGGVRPFSSLGHPTQLGLWMALMIIWGLEHRTLWSRVTAAVAGVVCVATLSRAGWLAAGVGVSVWVLLSRPALLRSKVTWLLISVALGAGLSLDPIRERLLHFFTAPTRWMLWNTAWQGFQRHPWFGWGLDSFVLVDQELRSPEAWHFEWGTTANHAHALIPNVAATQGLLGLLTVAVLTGFVLRRWWQLGPAERRPVSMAVVAACAAGNLVAFELVPVAALGLWCLVDSLVLPVRLATRLTPVWWLAAFLVSVGFVASLAAGFALSGPDPIARDRALRGAAQLEPWNAAWPTRLGYFAEMEGRFPEARAHYERGAALAPTVAVYEANVGRVSARLGDVVATRSWFDDARHHAPWDARIARDAADASLALDDLTAAEATIVAVLGRYPADGPTWLALAHLRMRQGRPLEARGALEAAQEADFRDWPQGALVARRSLAALLAAEGSIGQAQALIESNPPQSQTEDICGAPARTR